MNDFGRRVNSIIVKNLPTGFEESQLEELFSKFGRIVSSKVLPTNPNFDGGCGFVNFADADSCNKAVEAMNNFAIDRFTLRVSHSSTRMNGSNSDRPSNGFHTNGEAADENGGSSSPNTQNRFSGFRSASARSSANATPSYQLNTPTTGNEPEASSVNQNKSSWNGTSNGQPVLKNPFQRETTMHIREHDSFITNKTYAVYLSNLEVPNVIYTATVEDYVTATLLITQMNKHEQLTKVQADAYKSKLVVGQWCAALFNGDWYRAHILKVEENRVQVQYIDWGNSGWCDSILEIRPLPNEYYKDPVLSVKCVLAGVPVQEKIPDEQTSAILDILVLDTKLEMTVTSVENGVPHVQLNLGERSLNSEIRALLPSSASPAVTSQSSPPKMIDFDSMKADMSKTDMHLVQLTTVDTEPGCFHVLLIRDCLPTIMNVLKDWNASKQPMTAQPKPNTLVCAQYEGDDLWYRAWVKAVTDAGVSVYFVDFGNEEVVAFDRLSECPDILRPIPWQSVQIRLANITLTDDERYLLLRDFETDRLDMRILSKDREIYSVELTHNGKSLSEHMLELRRKKEPSVQKPPVPKEFTEPPQQKAETAPVRPMAENSTKGYDDVKRPTTSTSSSIFDDRKPTVPVNENRTLPPAPSSSASTPTTKPPNTVGATAKPLPSNGHNNDSPLNEDLVTMITEQRRQNRLLEQVIAAINTTNALLTQLVQR